MTHGHGHGPGLQNLGPARGHFQHFFKRDAVDFLRLWYDPRVGGVNTIHISVDIAAISTDSRRHTIAPQIKAGKNVLIAAHGNSLRALIKYLDGVSQEEIIGMNVPTGMPLVYDLDENLKPTNRQYLGDPEKVAKAMEAVANQGKAK